ncbi:hypothetical protein D3C71_2062500 [compost metagenome]
MRFVMGGFEEIFGLEALADHAALHVGKGDEYGVDAAGGDILAQGVEGIGGHGSLQT